ISTEDISHSPVNSNDTPKQIVPQCDESKTRGYTTDILISDITDNTLNSNNTHEQIVSRNEESNTSNHEVTASGNSDTQQELETSTSPIPAETISLEEKEENEFLDSMYKETVSKEIMERIREKKLRDQELLSTPENNICCEQSLIQEKYQEISVTNPDDRQKEKCQESELTNHNIYVTEEPDEIEPTKRQYIEQELIKELLSSNPIVPPVSSEIIEYRTFQITTQSLVLIEICRELGVTDKTARTQLYKEMLNHLSGITSGNL
ncbi:8210_t:CDS:2, partial [Diversispora eburnea]